jgi:hypothetical protein
MAIVEFAHNSGKTKFASLLVSGLLQEKEDHKVWDLLTEIACKEEDIDYLLSKQMDVPQA